MDIYKILFFIVIQTVFCTQQISADTLTSSENHSFIKCETPHILKDYLTGTRKIAIRLELHTSIISPQGHFRVHYDTTGFHAPDMTDQDYNDIPDYVDSTLVYLEYAWNLQVNKLGYEPPKSDDGAGGGDEIDVYIRNYGTTGGYGGTYPVNTVNGSSSAYCHIDNDYSENQYASKGYDGLKVTTAHEFFHVIQFRYLTDYSLIWWMEQTAVWMEEKAWDDINDYLAYLKYFFQLYKNSPLDTSNGYFKYGAVVWPLYLAKRFGDDQIRILWEHLSSTGIHNITVFDEVIPSGLSEAYGQFAVWNYFTKDRANTIDFYPDSDRFNQLIDMDYQATFSPTVDSLETNYLTSKYVELLFLGNWEEHDVLRIKVTPTYSGSFISSVVFYNNPHDYRIHTIDPAGEDIPLEKYWEKAILIISCTSTYGKNYGFIFETGVLQKVITESKPLYTFTLHGAYPNPFNPATTIRFTLPESGHVSIRIFNAQGQKVTDLYEGNLNAGEKSILWKPHDLAGGVYLVNITTPGESKTTKLLFLK